MKSLGIATLALGLLALAAPAAHAGTIYAISGAGGATSNLYTVDGTTGLATLVGATGYTHMTSIDFDPTTGVMYGVVSDGFSGASQLVTINTSTGAGSIIGALTPSSGGGTPDISFDSSGQLYGWFEGADQLGLIDKTSGATTILPTGNGTSNTGLAFDAADTLYMKSFTDMYTVNPLTGAATFSASLTGPGGLQNALEFDPDTGQLYSLQRVGGSDGFLALIDLGTSSFTLLGASGIPGFSGIAVQGTVVPEPGTIALFGLGTLGLLGVVRRRRKAKIQTA